jgi:hypothetical protein
MLSNALLACSKCNLQQSWVRNGSRVGTLSGHYATISHNTVQLRSRISARSHIALSHFRLRKTNLLAFKLENINSIQHNILK